MFGQLSSAKLFLRCEYLFRATNISGDPCNGIVRIAGIFMKCVFRFDSLNDDISSEVYMLPLGTSHDYSSCNDDTFSSDGSLSDKSSLPDQKMLGLVLKAAEAQGEYRRIAKFIIRNTRDVAIHPQDSSYHDLVQIAIEQDNSPVDFFELCKGSQCRANDAEFLPKVEEENESDRGNWGRSHNIGRQELGQTSTLAIAPCSPRWLQSPKSRYRKNWIWDIIVPRLVGQSITQIQRKSPEH